MKIRFVSVVALLLCLTISGFAHRLNEYLQATMISLEKDHVQISMRLIPGVAVLPAVLASIDTNHDGLVSDAEEQAYAHSVLREISLTLDGIVLRPKLVSVRFPALSEMQEGLGEITIEVSAILPEGDGNRKLVLRNHHQSAIAVFLVNCLVPRDPNLRVLAQSRNYDQSLYELSYVQVTPESNTRLVRAWSAVRAWSGVRTWLGSLGDFPSMFRLGMRHIGEGTDHLLFLLALLLPSPLLVVRSRWGEYAGVRHSALHILRVVSAFTLGHSITLALAGLGLVRLPSRPIEVLIAFSIFVSAAHALRPMFPGREAAIAAIFGLLHGLAFATTLEHLGLHWWERMVSILSFNLGIEAMQLIVVASAMPSLVLLSSTRAYTPVRIGSALCAMLASASWISERLLNIHSPFDALVDGIAHRAVWIAAVLFLISTVWWALRSGVGKLDDDSSHYPNPVRADS